jgi:alpha-1,2-mannosyltransferase
VGFLVRALERCERLLTWKRARSYSLALVFVYVFAWCYVLVTGDPPLNRSGVPIGGDFIAFYTAGRLVLTGEAANLYEHDRVAALQHEILGGRAPGLYDAFRNPPFFVLPFVPLAVLDLVPGFAVWFIVSSVCLAVALWLLLDEVPELRRRWRGLVAIVLAFAPVYFGLIDGENATLSLLLYVLIYRALVRDQPGLAGMWAAFGLFKPQLFVVFPLVFVARRSWRALLTYSVTALALGAVSLALVGVAGLQAWLRILLEPEAGNAMANAWRMASVKSFFDVLLPGNPALALGVYLASAVLLLGGLIAVWSRRRVSRCMAWILTCLVAVLVNPHMVDYDLSVLVPAGVLAAQLAPTVRVWFALLYPLLVLRVQVPLGDSMLQLSPLIIAVCLGIAWARLRPTLGLQPARAVVGDVVGSRSE